jgi:transposase
LQRREIAHRLRVSPQSALIWRRAYKDGGIEALPSKGASGQRPYLDPEQITQLCAALDQGPAAHGHREDQRWTLEL